jgi:hypothetical protein
MMATKCEVASLTTQGGPSAPTLHLHSSTNMCRAIKEDEMDGSSGTYGGEEKVNENYFGET